MRSLMVISFVVSLVLAGCSRAEREPTGNTKSAPPADAPATGTPGASGSPASGTTTLAPLSIDDAEDFVTSWCGSGTLTNVRQLDADDYLVSSDGIPAWILGLMKNFELVKLRLSDTGGFGWSDGEAEVGQLIEDVKKEPTYNAMLPTGKMILADFSSGSGCRKTSIVIDALAAAYLKKLKDASSADAITCEKKSRGDFHRLDIKSPALPTNESTFSGCDSGLTQTLVGHASTGTLTVVDESAILLDDQVTDISLTSYIIEADGSAQFLRSDGALKFYSRMISEPDVSRGRGQARSE